MDEIEGKRQPAQRDDRLSVENPRQAGAADRGGKQRIAPVILSALEPQGIQASPCARHDVACATKPNSWTMHRLMPMAASPRRTQSGVRLNDAWPLHFASACPARKQAKSVLKRTATAIKKNTPPQPLAVSSDHAEGDDQDRSLHLDAERPERRGVSACQRVKGERNGEAGQKGRLGIARDRRLDQCVVEKIPDPGGRAPVPGKPARPEDAPGFGGRRADRDLDRERDKRRGHGGRGEPHPSAGGERKWLAGEAVEQRRQHESAQNEKHIDGGISVIGDKERGKVEKARNPARRAVEDHGRREGRERVQQQAPGTPPGRGSPRDRECDRSAPPRFQRGDRRAAARPLFGRYAVVTQARPGRAIAVELPSVRHIHRRRSPGRRRAC